MANKQATLNLPDDLREFFCDYDAVHLSWDRSRHTIVLRLLEKGGMHAVRWLRQQMSDEEIREFIVRRRGRGISPRRLRFWSLLVDIPHCDVDAWIEAARHDPWQNRVAR